MSRITHSQVQKMVGKSIYALRKDGSVISGKLARIQGNQLVFEQPKGKKVQTKALFSLALFDVLALGTFDGGYGYGYDGFGYGGFDGGFGWW